MIHQIYFIVLFCIVFNNAAIVLHNSVKTKPLEKSATDDNNAAQFNSPTLLDVELHSAPGANGGYVQHGPATWAHEGVHGVDTTLCLRTCSRDPFQFFCAYYILDGEYVIVDNPKVVNKKDHCIPFIPESLRIGRYDHYFNLQDHPAHNSPNYILEEWNAYITGTKTTLESWPDYWTDPGFVNGLQGAPEFAILYSSCIAAYLKYEPEYLKSENVLGFLKFEYERSFDLYHKTRAEKFTKQFPGLEDQQFNAFLTDPGAKEMRDALKQVFGQEFWDKTILKGEPTANIIEPSGMTPEECGFSAWSMWSACSLTCNDGVRSRTRTSSQGCWATSESESCGTGDCPNDSSNGEARPDEVQPFKPEDYTAQQLGLIYEPSSTGGSDITHDPNMQPTLKPIPAGSVDHCFPAAAQQSNTTVFDFLCDRAPKGALEAGELVVVVGAARSWDKICGYGWFADVKYYKADGTMIEGQIRQDALLQFPDKVDCDAKISGQIKKSTVVVNTSPGLTPDATPSVNTPNATPQTLESNAVSYSVMFSLFLSVVATILLN